MNKTPSKTEKDINVSYRCIECNENEEKSCELICVASLNFLNKL